MKIENNLEGWCCFVELQQIRNDINTVLDNIFLPFVENELNQENAEILI